MLDSYPITLAAQARGNGAIRLTLPRSAMLVGVQKDIQAVSGATGGQNIDINQNGAALLTGITPQAAAAGGYDSWKSKHLGGEHEAVELAKDAPILIDVNTNNNVTITGTLTLYLLWGEL